MIAALVLTAAILGLLFLQAHLIRVAERRKAAAERAAAEAEYQAALARATAQFDALSAAMSAMSSTLQRANDAFAALGRALVTAGDER